MPQGAGGRAWLFVTARRVLTNQARARARRDRLTEKLNVQPLVSQAAEDFLAGRVNEALAALGARDREVLLLAEWEGLTPSEIAKTMRARRSPCEAGCLFPSSRGSAADRVMEMPL